MPATVSRSRAGPQGSPAAVVVLSERMTDAQLAEILGELPASSSLGLPARPPVPPRGVPRAAHPEPAMNAAAAAALKEAPVTNSDERALPFELVGTDGGEFSRDYCCRNMLRKDNTCYSSTKREGVHVVVEMRGVPYFTLTDVEAIAPREGYTSPLGQAVVFVSWDLPVASETTDFDQVHDQADYEAAVLRHTQGRSAMVPILFLDLEDCFHVQQHLPIPRSGRYILIKMLRSQRSGENVDVQYFGFRGWTAPHAFEEGMLV